MAKFIQYSTKDSQYDGPFDSKVGWAAAGMGDLIVSGNGKLIVVDGGNVCDAEALVELLEKYSDGKKPEVELWIITHPHGDHYWALNSISKTPLLRSMEALNRQAMRVLKLFGNTDVKCHPQMGR